MDVKGNFKQGNTNLECTKCEKEVETQQHILQCEALSSNSVVTQLPEYEDLHGADPDKIRRIGLILLEKFTLLRKPSAHIVRAATGSNQQPAGDLSVV